MPLQSSNPDASDKVKDGCMMHNGGGGDGGDAKWFSL